MMSRSDCVLIPADGNFPTIHLDNGKTVKLGRSPTTQICDKRCAREQVEVIADYEAKELKLVQLGRNPSQVKDRILQQKANCILGDGDKFCLLRYDFEYQVKFHDDQSRKRRSIDDVCLEESPIKKRNCELVAPVKDPLIAAPYRIIRSFEEPNSTGWTELKNLLVYATRDLQPSTKIASFDLDGTLIDGGRSRKFSNEWRLAFSTVKKKLRELHSIGCKLVIFTNQLGIGNKIITKDSIEKKIVAVTNELGLPFQVYVSTNRGVFRKPFIGMWQYLAWKGNEEVKIDLESSFYVGDAAGRPLNWQPGKHKDFSCSDRAFATNVGIRFYTPEEFFINGRKANFYWPQVNPKNLVIDEHLCCPSNATIASDKQEVIVLVGMPGAGKSNFVKRHLIPHGYVQVNRDRLKSWQKCVDVCQFTIKRGSSVVIDNTNPDKLSRKRYIDCARSKNLSTRCFLFTTGEAIARHNNQIREASASEGYEAVTNIAFNTFKSRYEEPLLSEGFSEIIKINFIPKFEDESEELFYKQLT